MITISLCMIVRNEERTLARCLDSAAGLADDIVIVDTGSTDRTCEIAAHYTDRVLSFAWRDDFAAARNFSFEQASGDYILWLDADDVLLPRDATKLAELKRQLSQAGGEAAGSLPDAFIFDYCLAEGPDGRPLVVSRRNRLVKREAGCRWSGRLHELLDFPQGTVVTADIAVTHRREAKNHSARNVRILRKWIAEEGASGRRLYFYASECLDRRRYAAAARAYEKLLREPAGYREDRIIACARLAECYGMLGNQELRLEALMQSFRYGIPHADICCSVAECFQRLGMRETAVYWYLQAVDLRDRDTGLRPVPAACLTWLPHAQLSLLYAGLGRWQAACDHNARALEYAPDNPGLLANRLKLQAMLKA